MAPPHDEIVKAFLSACMKSADWESAFLLLLRRFHSQCGLSWDRKGMRKINIPYSFGLPAAYVSQYEVEWSLIDPTPQYMLAKPEKRVVSDGFVTDAERDSNPYLREHAEVTRMTYRLADHDVLYLGRRGGFTVHRDRKYGPFTAAEEAEFEYLHPFLRHALMCRHQLEILQAGKDCAENALDHGSIGIILLDRHGCICNVNARAKVLLDEGDGLRRLGGRLVLSDLQDDQKLQTEIKRVIGLGEFYLGGLLKGQRRYGAPPYAISVRPAPQSRMMFGSFQPAVCVMVAETYSERRPEPNHLTTFLGLSPREAQLACLLAEGLCPALAAAKLGIKRNTAASYLHHIYQKTGTDGQSGLVALVLRTTSSVAMFGPPSNASLHQ